MILNTVAFAYRVFYCKDVLVKNSGPRFMASLAVFAVLLILLGVSFWAASEEPLSLWLARPLCFGSVLVSLLLGWAFGQIRTSEATMLLYDNLPLAQRLTINTHNLQYASLLLDVGKLGIPRSIINKTGKLEPEEWDLVRRHPELAVKILQPIKSFDTVSNWIKYHHERVDGTGYYHLRNDQIPLASRLLAVADTYSAMTMERSYRATMTHEEAISELKQAAGTQLDADIVNIFCHIPYKKIEESMNDVRRAMSRYADGDFRIRPGDIGQ